MGSLVRRKHLRVFLGAVAALILFGLLSPPSWAGSVPERSKLKLLELLGLDGADPAVIMAAQEAHTLYSIDVVPGQDTISVILQMSGLPDYDSYHYTKDRRLVVDLSNTINLSPSSVQGFRETDPIRQVRNSQYRVSPSLISRVVLDLEQDEMPQITNDGKNVIITALLANKAGAPESQASEQQIIPVPAVKVNTAAPQVDVMLAEVPQEPVETADVEAQEEMVEVAAEAAPVAQEPDEIGELLADTLGAEAMAAEQVDEAVLEDAPAIEESVMEVAAVAEEPAAEAEPVVDTAEEVPAEPVPLAENMVSQEAAFEPQNVDTAAEVSVEPKEQMVEVPVEVTPEPAKLAQLEPAAAPVPALVEAPAQQLVKTNNLVTLNFRDAELSAVLDILARKGNLNILAGKDVKGNVTVRLVDVPFDVALNAVLNVNGFGYIRTDNIVRVVPLSQLGTQVETRTETFNLSYASSESVKATFQSLLSPHGKIETDKRTNLLIVTDVPTNLDRIRELIPQVDRRVQQVLIEVLILDSILIDAADLGIQWNLVNTDDASPAFGEIEDGIGANLPFTATVGAGLDFAVGTLINDYRLSVMIQALLENTDSRILANPKILTLDNEQASIEIISEFPYNDVTQTSSGGQLSNITFKEIGTKLDVKPQVTHDQHVILWIEPEQNSIAGETITGVPIVDTRRAETTLIVRNHQTIVLGGLRENRKIKSMAKVPFLGDLPGVKYAFRSVASNDRDTELLVFLTVHIVESPPLLAQEEIKFDELANMPRKPYTSIDLIR